VRRNPLTPALTPPLSRREREKMGERMCMNKLQLTYELACEFTSALGYPVATGDGELNVLCLEGAAPLPELPGLVELNRNTPNAPDLYNDCVVLFWKEAETSGDDKGVLKEGIREEGGVSQGVSQGVLRSVLRGVLRVRVLRATTEPGRYYTRIDPHPAGAAHLMWGHHLYKPGKHRGKPALVSASGLDRVWRDRDGDFTQDMTERVYIGRFGIHVHAGGRADSIGRWSAGCIAIHGGYEGEPYLFFLDRIERHPGRLFNLVLWGARDMCSWLKSRGQPVEPYVSDECVTGCVTGVTGGGRCVTGGVTGGVTGCVTGWKPTLRYGITSPWVARMQRLLSFHLDCRLVSDGDWGPMTQDAFLRFQREAGLVVDGICGPRSWERLEKA
jgi:hypothetical protein